MLTGSHVTPANDFVSLDADQKYFDGAKTYKVTLPKAIPQEKFWSLTLYDGQTSSLLDTPRAAACGSQRLVLASPYGY
jgi:hypothetical protein